jgi:Arc/MetJ-type ribon-helix-helix transcriptional regulator
MGSRGKTEKMSVTLPRELAGEIRAIVSQGEVSAFFTEALDYYLSYRKQKLALERGFGAWKTGRHSDLANPEDSTAYVRTIREAGRKRSVHPGGTGAK